MSTTHWDPQTYQSVASFVPALGEPLIELLAPQASDRILDLGCGDGTLTLKLQTHCAKVIGIDASEKMIRSAISKGIDAHVLDAHSLNFDNEFDKVFSNAALHWMKSPENVIKGIHKSLKKNGMFVAELGGFNNAKLIVDAIVQSLQSRNISFENPWYFPKAEEYKNLLCKNGFKVDSIETFDRLTPLTGHLSAWIATFGQVFFKSLNKQQTKLVIDEVTHSVENKLLIAQQWHVDYVRLRVSAYKL